ncbi:uncharacterized protein UDID_18058 [Ustilago sp. UG-2017a]|nr:uncharacterized protein UDID_18058 [Ustilago sp. UG-2017a]
MGTWEVVHQPPGVPLVDSKVVLRLKLDADGVPVKHKEAIYMKPPEGSGVAPGQVYKVVKGLYGLKQSREEWNQEFDRSLQHMGFFQVECAPCIYTKGQGEDMAIVVIYIDDTLVIAPRLETVLKVKKKIGQKWKMEDSGESGYIGQVLAKHLDKRTKPTMVPMQSIPEGTLVTSAAQQKEYPVIVGKLLWVANSTWPDLSLTMGILTRHMHEPSQEHYQAAQWVLRYLKSTKEVGLVYRANESQEPLVAHSDANWASDTTIQRRSTSGLVVLVYGNPVAWKSAMQKCVSLSAVEAEFIAAMEATHEMLFLKQLLRSIGIATGTPTIYSDNTGCIQVSKDPAQHWKLKHIDTKYHFIHNNVQEGRVQIVRGRAPETQRWLGTINIDMKVMVTPRSGVSVDGDEVDDVGDEVDDVGDEVDDVGDELYESTLFVEYCTGGPSSTTPVLLSCVDSFDTAPPPCLAPLCLLSSVDFFDTAPPPQDLLAGLLYTAPPPSTGDGSFGSYLSSP